MTTPEETNRKVAVWKDGKFIHPDEITLPEARDNFNRLVEQEGAALADSGPAAPDPEERLDPEVHLTPGPAPNLTAADEINRQVELYSAPNRSIDKAGGGPRELTVQTGGTPDSYIAAARGSTEPTVGWTPATPEQLAEIKAATAQHDAIVASEQAQRDSRLLADLKGMLARMGKLLEEPDDEK